MATLIPATFAPKEGVDTRRGQVIYIQDIKPMLDRVVRALETITGQKGKTVDKIKNPQDPDGQPTAGIDYPTIAVNGTLFKLTRTAAADRLKENYLLIWRSCTVEFDEDERGAEVLPDGNRIILGPFMYSLKWTPDTEKTIIHEFLHVALADDWQTGRSFGPLAQHQQINPIIKRRLGYPGSPNPANPAEEG
jgi:hypothetical protein